MSAASLPAIAASEAVDRPEGAGRVKRGYPRTLQAVGRGDEAHVRRADLRRQVVDVPMPALRLASSTEPGVPAQPRLQPAGS